jgi:hypothetical protein
MLKLQQILQHFFHLYLQIDVQFCIVCNIFWISSLLSMVFLWEAFSTLCWDTNFVFEFFKSNNSHQQFSPTILCACVSSSSLLQVYEGITFYSVHQFCDVVVISKCNIMIWKTNSYVTQFRQGGDSRSKIETDSGSNLGSWMWSSSELILKNLGAILRIRIQISEFDFGIENVVAILARWCCEVMLWD